MMRQIKESGMLFEIPEESLYHIETSELVRTTKYFKTPEFVYVTQGNVVLVEAKTSVPRPESRDEFGAYLTEIREKFMNAVALLNACWEQRNKTELDKMPVVLQKVGASKAEYKLYLVIATAQEEWLAPVNDALKSELQILFKIWNIPDFAVKTINKAKAIQIGLVKE